MYMYHRIVRRSSILARLVAPHQISHQLAIPHNTTLHTIAHATSPYYLQYLTPHHLSTLIPTHHTKLHYNVHTSPARYRTLALLITPYHSFSTSHHTSPRLTWAIPCIRDIAAALAVELAVVVVPVYTVPVAQGDKKRKGE